METDYGVVEIGDLEELHARTAGMMQHCCLENEDPVIGLTGGSTPKSFYDWAVNQQKVDPEILAKAYWTTSDERVVPLESDESNFGNASRAFLDPLGIPEDQRLPWPTQVDPHSAVIVFNRNWAELFGVHRGYDLCFLGMGADGHTASLFPGSPIIGLVTEDNFSCVELDQLGWRLTVNETGISRSREIVVLVTGAAKAERLQRVFRDHPDENQMPIQILRRYAEKTRWLVDHEAAAGLR